MPTKEVKVIINGEEFVSKAADKAEGALSGFAGKAMKWIGGLAALGVGAALGGFFKKAIEESLEGEVAMARLEQAVASTGASFTDMKPAIDKTVSDLMRLTTFTDDELNGALSDMILRTGDAKGSLANLGLAADLAAAKNIPLADASKAVANAMAGNTTALAKMIPELKGSSDMIGDLRTRVDGAAEAMGATFSGSLTRAKNQFGELAQAVGDAILGSDSLQGSGNILVDTLVNLAKWVESNREEIGQLVDVIVMVAKNIYEALVPSFRMLGAIGGPVLKLIAGLVSEASFAIRALAIFSQDMASKVIGALGSVVEKGGKVLKAFGITVVAESGTAMKKFADETEAKATSSWTKLEADYKTFHTRMKSEGDRAVTTVGAQEKQKTVIVGDNAADREKKEKDSLKEQEKAYDGYIKQVKDWYAILNKSVVSYREILQTLGPAAEKALEPSHIKAFNATLDASKKNADMLIERMKAIPLETVPGVGILEKTVKAVSINLEESARTTLDVVQAFGLLDASTASVLNSVINVGKAIGNIINATSKEGLAGGIAAVVSGIANIGVQILAGDAARKKLIAENNAAIAKNTAALGDLNLNVSGDDLLKSQRALESVVGQLRGGRGAANQTDVLNALRAQGLTMADLDRIANEVGIRIKSDSGALSVDGIKQLLQALGTVEIGRVGSSFAEQLAFFKESQRLDGASGVTQGKDLLEFLKNAGGVGALRGIDFSDPAQARNALLALRTQLNNGTGIDASQLGQLTGSEFKDAILELIGFLDDAKNDGGVSTGPSTNTGGGATGAGTDDLGTITNTAGAPSASTALLTAVKAQTDALEAYHVEDITFLSRIAIACERSADTLDTIDGRLARLDEGFADLIDRRMGAQRVLAQASAGQANSF